MGDRLGHPFRGNQWTKGSGGVGESNEATVSTGDWGARGRVERVGSEDEPRGKTPNVDWSKQDLEDSSAHVTADTVRRDYDAPKGAAVYRAWVPAEDVPNPVLAEEKAAEEWERAGYKIDEDDVEAREEHELNQPGEYDWEEMRHGGSMPPAKLRVTPEGKVEIIDGNHRIRFCNDNDMVAIPAWVIDERKGAR